MKQINRRRFLLLFLSVLCMCGLTGCGGQVKEETKQVKNEIQIGFSFDSLVIERWQRDRDVFVSQAQEDGAKVNVQNAGGDVETQKKQIMYFIEQKMDVIVVVAVDTAALSDVVKKAKESGIRVVAYDRMLENAGVDLCVSFDSEKVGNLYAKAIRKKFPKGAKLLEIMGSSEDYNVKLLEKGLSAGLRKSDTVVKKAYAKGWIAEHAYQTVSDFYEKGGNCDAIICGNDDLAAQAILALSENRKTGKVYVLGQDGDLSACQRIVEGTQGGTVFKNVDELAKRAATMCVKLAKGEEISGITKHFDGTNQVDSYFLTPVFVDKKNLNQIIIDGGFHTKEEVYINE